MESILIKDFVFTFLFRYCELYHPDDIYQHQVKATTVAECENTCNAGSGDDTEKETCKKVWHFVTQDIHGSLSYR